MASLVDADITEIRQASNGLAGYALAPGAIGGACLGGAVLLAGIAGWGAFVHAYLLAVMFVTSLGVGGLFFVLGHHITGGRWGTTVRRLAEITASTLTISFVLYLPVLVGVVLGGSSLYPWNIPVEEMDSIIRGKSAWLSPNFFAIRAVIYYLLWIWMARTMLGWSVRQDSSEPLKRAQKMQKWAGPMLILYAATMNGAAFDWIMSLEPHWFSTMFGVCFFAGSFGAVLALMIWLANFLQSRGVLTQSITTEHYHDLSKLMYAFVVFWAYVTFSQYMLIWYAAIPEETLWYDVRTLGVWPTWGIFLAIGHLFVPFLGFMSSAVRRNKKLMAGWAIWMLVMHWMDLAFMILPQVRADDSEILTILLSLLTTAGTIGIFAWAWMSGAAGKWLLPVQDPRLPIALSYHNH